jgi:L-ascorbate metabolism protein UlaG (beta-lactamase superfamily)
MKTKWLASLLIFLMAGLYGSVLGAQNVTITPLGAAAGEFCAGDRALLFQDPTGVRILIAPGRTVNGSGDGRLPNPSDVTGGVHVLLIDHPHVDHIGDVFHTTCAGGPTQQFAFPNDGNAPEIAAVHKSAVLVGGELPDFFTQKISNVSPSFAALSAPQKSCPASGLDNVVAVPSTARAVDNACVGVIRGGTRTAVFQGASQGVKITTIPAFHAAGASRMHIDDPNVPAGLTGYAGHETGYIIRFTNGLTVLWTGDSGLIGDWETQSRFYRPNLAVVHGGDLFTMGPDEAAFAVEQLIRPRTVIPEHFNEISTYGGAVRAGTRLERFIQQIKGNRPRVIVTLRGKTISCDGRGNCTQAN